MDLNTLGLLIVCVLIFVFYFLPSIIAFNRKNHPNRGCLFFINLFFGWVPFVWLAILVWSFCSTGPRYTVEYIEKNGKVVGENVYVNRWSQSRSRVR